MEEDGGALEKLGASDPRDTELYSGFSKPILQISSIRITQALVLNVNSQGLQDLQDQNSGTGAQDSVFKSLFQNFPGSPVLKTPPSNVRGVGLTPGPRTNVPCAAGCGQFFLTLKKLKKEKLFR